MADTAQATAVPGWVLQFMDALDALELWTAGDGVRLLRGEAVLAKKSEPERVVRAPFMHVFYLDQEEPVCVRTLRVTAGPLQTDAVM
ncbi:hypothetical protein [Streptomyces sp. NPDC002566]|uniref:hypothetical protein n=1 Tax=Streptomyces sp. NPDC002566 TaxID=3364650 RepID=UPI0036811837